MRILDPSTQSSIRIERYSLGFSLVANINGKCIYEARPSVPFKFERLFVTPADPVVEAPKWLRALWWLLAWVTLPHLVRASASYDYDEGDEEDDYEEDEDVNSYDLIDRPRQNWKLLWRRPVEDWRYEYNYRARMRAFAGCRITSITVQGNELLYGDMPAMQFTPESFPIPFHAPTCAEHQVIRVTVEGGPLGHVTMIGFSTRGIDLPQ